MKLNNTGSVSNNIPAQKTLSATKAPSAPKATSAQVKPSPAPVVRSVANMISAAKLPSDKLSASIVSFARFFSLPLKPQVMADIRRQSLSGSVPKREALSLAAASAESKGVELSQKGLAEYAKAIDPEQARQEGQNRQNRQNDQGEQHSQERQNGQYAHNEQNQQKRNQNDNDEQRLKSAPVTANAVEKRALSALEQDPLLSILNKLPGKNGRWIVLPFEFTEDGRDFRVSIRLLLDQVLALDIAENERKWLFVLTPAVSHGETSFRELTVYIQPELPARDRAGFVRELSQSLDIPTESVFIKKRPESFPCEAGFHEQGQSSIDEVV